MTLPGPLGAYAFARGCFRDHGLTPGKLGLAALGGGSTVCNWVVPFRAYEATSISLATVVHHTQPFFPVLLGVRRRRPAPPRSGR